MSLTRPRHLLSRILSCVTGHDIRIGEFYSRPPAAWSSIPSDAARPATKGQWRLATSVWLLASGRDGELVRLLGGPDE